MGESTPQIHQPAPTCFVSYSWDSEEHKAWVRRFATALRSAGVDARIDQWEARLGMDLPKYMEERIRSSDYIAIICTPGFAARANSGKGGVGYEKGIITGEIYHGAQPTKFIPVLRVGDPMDALPSYLLNKLFVDCRVEVQFDAAIQAIVRHICQKPESEVPVIGSPDVVGHTGITSTSRQQQEISFAVVLRYACANYPGLDVTPDHIQEIADNLGTLGYHTLDDLDMAIRPVRHIAREVECRACRHYACDQIAIALALSNPDYFPLLGPHQAQHTVWLREHRPRLRSDRKGWL